MSYQTRVYTYGTVHNGLFFLTSAAPKESRVSRGLEESWVSAAKKVNAAKKVLESKVLLESRAPLEQVLLCGVS
jgi:hypothetical protein